MTVVVTTQPQYLNARSGVYGGWDLRRFTDADPAGPGVADFDSFRVLQRQSGANMSVDIGKTPAVLMVGWVRGTTRKGQGLYRVDNVDTTAPGSSAYLAQLNLTIAAADATNPRIDQVYLAIQDSQHSGASNQAVIDVVAGTPTVGATLLNRTGAGALPASAILLADVLVPAASASVVTANLVDRRPWAIPSVPTIMPGAAGLITDDAVQLVPLGVSASATRWNATAIGAGSQSAAAFWLPRPITGVTKLRFNYLQGATANVVATSFNVGICDASGRLLVSTGAQSPAGLASTLNLFAGTIGSTDFDAGVYWVVCGGASFTAASNMYFEGVPVGDMVTTGDIGNTHVAAPVGMGGAVALASGGTTLPSNLAAFIAEGSGERMGVPTLTLTRA